MPENELKKEKVARKDGNREVLSDVFSMLLEYPANALDVYNALNGSDYKDPELVTIVKLKLGISLSVRNDASFIIGETLNFYEHQSTYNPNMPLRHLIYYVDYMKDWVKINNKNLYGKSRIQLPTPRFVVFYNGAQDRPDIEEMRLSSSFLPATEKGMKGDIELVCRVYNINSGHNAKLIGTSKVLWSYGHLVDKMRMKCTEGRTLEEAIDESIEECIDENVLKEFLLERRDEVRKIMKLDFTWERREQLIREEEFQEGLSQGISQSILEVLESKGGVPEDLRDEILSIKNSEKLSLILKMAARAKGMDEFVNTFHAEIHETDDNQ